MQAIVFPNISPIAFSIFGFNVYWYSFAYLIGIYLGYILIKKLNSISKTLTSNAIDDLLLYCVFGIIIGGRLGFCLIYDLNYTLTHPYNIFLIRNGGMSFHGGLAGVILAGYAIALKHRLKFLNVTDLIACVAPIGIFFGRLANFINAEIYGKITTMPWGVIFPNAGNLPRHPTQIYEAIGEGVILLIVLISLFPRFYRNRGFLSGVFLICYAIVRITVEFFKEPQEIDKMFLTAGQLLCIPMLILGMYLIYKSFVNKDKKI